MMVLGALNRSRCRDVVSSHYHRMPVSNVQALSLIRHRNANLRVTIAVVPTITSESSSRRGSAHLDK